MLKFLSDLMRPLYMNDESLSSSKCFSFYRLLFTDMDIKQNEKSSDMDR